MDNDKKPAQYDTHYIANRMARTIGHVRLVRSMVECNADCTEVLIQPRSAGSWTASAAASWPSMPNSLLRSTAGPETKP